MLVLPSEDGGLWGLSGRSLQVVGADGVCDVHDVLAAEGDLLFSLALFSRVA
jgi:hypothetical protein